jgi:hypothetical protein
MDNWTGDQYTMPPDNHPFYGSAIDPISTNLYENKFKMEQQLIPAQYKCSCFACPLSSNYPKPRPAMRKSSVNSRYKDMLGGWVEAANAAMVRPAVGRREGVEGSPGSNIEIAEPLDIQRALLFIFVVIVLIFAILLQLVVKAANMVPGRLFNGYNL